MSLYSKLIHLFLPHESNNHKAKILHSSSILAVTLLLLLYQAGLLLIPRSGVRILGYAANISVDEIIRLTNEKRVQVGLSPLGINSELNLAAKAKGEDMINRDYWAHVAPDGTEPWKFFKDAGYQYRYAGENLARDFSDAGSAVEAWIASPSHKENLMSPKYKDIGIAVVEGDLAGSDTTIIVQLFGTRLADTLPAVPVAQAKAVGTEQKETPLPVQTTIALSEPVSGKEIRPNVLLSPFTTTKGISLSIVGLLLLVMTVDAFVVNKKGIIRISGRTFAHVSFFGMILAIVLILKAGEVL